jgi:hypothetical protein
MKVLTGSQNGMGKKVGKTAGYFPHWWGKDGEMGKSGENVFPTVLRAYIHEKKEYIYIFY